jgi:hypothetical protein
MLAREMRFATELDWQGIRGEEELRLHCLYEFVRYDSVDADGVPHQGRRFLVDTVAVHDALDRCYWLTGSGVRIDSARNDANRFLRVHTGLLAGVGRLNNHLLDLVVRFVENDGGGATAEVVNLDLKPA